jgi:hypothetical protein
MRFSTFMVGAIALSTAVTGSGKAQTVPDALPVPVGDLLACRTLPDAAERLSCFDRTTGAVALALERRDLVAVDREKVRSTRRSLFGLSLPNLSLFGDDAADELKQVDGVLVSVGRNREAGYTFLLEDGARWSQTDGKPIAIEPRRGDKIVIKRGALGSYTLSVGRQPGVKVQRVN